MSKLTSKDRKELPEKLFGLPDDKKYPLNDEEHVRKAIQFFKYCPPSKRTTLAHNINKRAKALGMKVNVGEQNPYYKLADKAVLQEGFLITQKDTLIPEGINPESLKLLSEVDSNFIMVSGDMVDLETNVISNIIPKLCEITLKDVSKRLNMINPLTSLNSIMKIQYRVFFDFVKYQDPNFPYDLNYEYHSVVDDICFIIDRKLYNSSASIEKDINAIKELMGVFTGNIYYIYRKICEILLDLEMNIINRSINQGTQYADTVFKKRTQLKQLLDYLKNPGEIDIFTTPKNIIGSVLKAGYNMNMINTEEYMNTMKNELKSQIDIILMTNEIVNIMGGWAEDKTFYLTDVPYENRDMFNIIDYATGSLKPNNIKYYGNYTLELDGMDMIGFSKIRNIVNKIYPCTDINGNMFYFGLKENVLYILGKTVGSRELILVKLYEGKHLNVIENFIQTDPSKLKSMIIKKINFTKQQDDIALTEGISIDGQGNIKFEIKPNKSYMDEYAENHKLLDANFKNKNYEGMKRNLAFLFALINTIERDVIHNKKSKLTLEEKKNAEKARAFAINDFKTYLKHLQKAEKDFDFTKYYEESGFDKFIVNIPHESVLGIKKLFKAILLA